MVAAGEVPVALTVYNYMPEQLKKKAHPSIGQFCSLLWFEVMPWG